MKQPQIKTVSEYLNSDPHNANSAFRKFACIDKASVVSQTEKAVCVEGVGFNRAGNECKKTAWFPKSQIVEIKNDHYTKASAEMILVPWWLVNKSGISVA
jgi:hypothetical protein